MPSCLGIYVEENLIKYAKVSKEHEDVKVEAFGIKFYDNLEETLKQIVTETYSFKTPISINISDEKYTTSNIFNLLNKKYLSKAINTEFEMFCNENGKNKNAIEMRYLESENAEDKDKTTILYSYCNKASIVTKAQIAASFRLTGIYPVPVVIANLSQFQNMQNSVIINIEDRTSVTTIVNGKISRVNQIELGMKEILNSINVKENSYQKSYEICKNSTIYTLGSQNLQSEDNDYMDDIMPTLYSIAEKAKEIINTNGIEIENIYLTGLATAINNIDLYFQENFPNKSCQILAPYFANKANLKLNVRDYIEVNSAIALAMQELDQNIKGVNFKKQSGLEGISKALSIDTGKDKIKEKPAKEKKVSNLNMNLAINFDKLERHLLRFGAALLLIIVVYIVAEKMIVGSINRKDRQVQEVVTDTTEKIATVENHTKLINARTSDYNSLVEKINEANEALAQGYARKNAIPNFLTQVMFNMPKDVQLVTITNTTSKTIKIVARAEKYEQLGYLKATLKNSGILTDITSTSGTKQNDVIEVTITGNLPY